MKMDSMHDTIAALATPPGRGAIGIVRISGPDSERIARALWGDLPPARLACLRKIRDSDGVPLDSGLLLYFPKPQSYTGEDVIEFQGHGGMVVLNMVLERTLHCGARRARPGEFTERAFLNGRMDLTQAEAVADLIDATSRHAARAAQRSLSGAFSQQVHALEHELTGLRVHVEAALDFPEEEIDLLAENDLQQRFQALTASIDEALVKASRGVRLRDAVCVVIAGAPNVGKSSLLNRLAGDQRAIVTEIAGTTRDPLREAIVLGGLNIELWDTAGLRESNDIVEREGVHRARERLAEADVVLWVEDATVNQALHPCSLPKVGVDVVVIKVRNKIDLSNQLFSDHGDVVPISALTGEGMTALEARLMHEVEQFHGEGEFTARQRHIDGLYGARKAIAKAFELLNDRGDGELIAEELLRARRELDGLLGRMTSDELLGEIFRTFCIGK